MLLSGVQYYEVALGTAVQEEYFAVFTRVSPDTTAYKWNIPSSQVQPNVPVIVTVRYALVIPMKVCAIDHCVSRAANIATAVTTVVSNSILVDTSPPQILSIYPSVPYPTGFRPSTGAIEWQGATDRASVSFIVLDEETGVAGCNVSLHSAGDSSVIAAKAMLPVVGGGSSSDNTTTIVFDGLSFVDNDEFFFHLSCVNPAGLTVSGDSASVHVSAHACAPACHLMCVRRSRLQRLMTLRQWCGT